MPRGEPLPGDRAVSDAAGYPLLHTNDTDTTDGIHHTRASLTTLFQGLFAPLIHATRHQAGGADAIKLDDLDPPDANTDLDASSTKHGLLPMLSGVGTQFLSGLGTWVTLTLSFLGLSDTPASYAGQAGKAVVVNPGETALIFGDPPASALDDLADVNAPTPADGDVLTWDEGNEEWINAEPTGGGGGTVLTYNRIGDIFYSASNTPPPGSLACDGSSVSKTTYQKLYEVIGDTFAYQNIVPALSGETAEWKVTCSSEAESRYGAFDGQMLVGRWRAGAGSGQWIKVENKNLAAFTIASYKIACNNEGGWENRSFYAWTVKDADGNVIDTRTGQSGWSMGEIRTYEVSVPTSTTAILFDAISCQRDFVTTHGIQLLGTTGGDDNFSLPYISNPFLGMHAYIQYEEAGGSYYGTGAVGRVLMAQNFI